MKRQILITLGLFSFWTLAGALAASQLYSARVFAGEETSWARTLTWQAPVWALWAGLTPAPWLVGGRFRFGQRAWRCAACVHTGASVAIASTHLLCLATIRWAAPLDPAYPVSFVSSLVFTASSVFHIDLLTYWAILGGRHAFDFHRQYQERELSAARLERQLAQAQLHALKMQLQPHFLFNALNSIAMLARKRENDQAVRMLAGLGDLLRYTLEQEEAQEISFERELEFIRRYLEIERVRFQDRLKLIVRVAPETLHAHVPNLILQPLAENAIRHGVAARAGAGEVEIAAWRERDQLILQVRDNGHGLPSDWDESQRAGVGLKNTRLRLQRLYGEAYQFTLSKETHGEGTTATLKIPFRTTNLHEKNSHHNR